MRYILFCICHSPSYTKQIRQNRPIIREEMQLLWKIYVIPLLWQKQQYKTSPTTTKYNCFDIQNNLKVDPYPIMRLPLTFLYKFSVPKSPNN